MSGVSYEKEGIESMPVLRGILDCPGIGDVWLDHLADAMRSDY